MSTTINNAHDVQKFLERAAFIQMKRKCKVMNCKSVSREITSDFRTVNPASKEKIKLCEPCWVAFMETCDTFEKQFGMLQTCAMLLPSEYVLPKPHVKRRRRQF